MTTEPNWDTGEVDLWLSNTEALYDRARRCTSAAAMRRKFTRCVPGIKWSQVDWDYLFAQFEEDRDAD